MPDRPPPLRRPWRSALLLVCRECDGTKGLRPKHVRSLLRRAAKDRLPRKAARVALVDCLDACPKRAVTVVVVGGPETAVRETAVRVGTPGHCDALVDDIADALERDR